MKRRTFLKASGISLALPFMPSLTGSTKARPPVKQTVKNLVCFGNGFGFNPHSFFPKITGKDYELSTLLKPLAKHKNDFTVFSGLSQIGVYGGHKGANAFLSGVTDRDKGKYKSGVPSLDQKVAEYRGNETRFPSIALESGTRNTGISKMKSGLPIPPITTPEKLFKDLFLQGDSAQIEKERMALNDRRSIIDKVIGQTKSVNRKLDKYDKAKLDQYLTSLREVEAKVDFSSSWLDKPKPKTDYKLEKVNGRYVMLPVFYDLTALALQTDSTRIVTLGASGSGGLVELPGVKGGYHKLTHHKGDQGIMNELNIIESFYTKCLADFITKLKESSSADGKSLLDDTILILGSGMADANKHQTKLAPVLIAGGDYKHGGHVKFPKNTPLCNLYMSVLGKFGIEEESFATSTGVLTW